MAVQSKQPLNTNSNFPQMSYDLIKEMLIAVGIMGALVLVLSFVFSTPDVPALSAKQVASQSPMMIVQGAVDDLSHQDAISTYGQPYNNTPGAAQALGPIAPQVWGGVQLPVNPSQADVIKPLTRIAQMDPQVQNTLQKWNSVSTTQQQTWLKTISGAMKHATIKNGQLVLPASVVANSGPVPQMLDEYLSFASSGLLESAIDGSGSAMPAINRTNSLLLLQDQPDGQYASKLDMTGDQWGVIKETGNYPGAVWLWFYTLLYQIPPFSASSAADLLVVITVFVVTALLTLTPFIPGLRSIPRWIPIYRLIWRKYYKETKG